MEDGNTAPAPAASSRAAPFTRPASRMSPSSRAGSKLTLVIVLKRARAVKTPIDLSRAPFSAARRAYHPIPFTARTRRSWSAEDSGSFPQTPWTTHPVPLAVCSHW